MIAVILFSAVRYPKYKKGAEQNYVCRATLQQPETGQ